MIKKIRSLREAPAIVRKADKALRIAVAKVIEEHRRKGLPLVFWENGRVVKVPVGRLPKTA